MGQRIGCQQLQKRIAAALFALKISRQPLLHLRVQRLSLADGTPTRQPHQRPHNACRCNAKQHCNQTNTRTHNTARWERIAVQQYDNRDGKQQRRRSQGRRPQQGRAQLQPAAQTRDVAVQFRLPAHASSRCVPM